MGTTPAAMASSSSREDQDNVEATTRGQGEPPEQNPETPVHQHHPTGVRVALFQTPIMTQVDGSRDGGQSSRLASGPAGRASPAQVGTSGVSWFVQVANFNEHSLPQAVFPLPSMYFSPTPVPYGMWAPPPPYGMYSNPYFSTSMHGYPAPVFVETPERVTASPLPTPGQITMAFSIAAASTLPP